MPVLQQVSLCNGGFTASQNHVIMHIKKTEINLKNRDRIGELKRELAMRVKVYPKQIELVTLHKFEANKRWLIMSDAVDLYKKLDRKGITHQQLLRMLDDLPDREDQGRQQKLSLL